MQPFGAQDNAPTSWATQPGHSLSLNLPKSLYLKQHNTEQNIPPFIPWAPSFFTISLPPFSGRFTKGGLLWNPSTLPHCLLTSQSLGPDSVPMAWWHRLTTLLMTARLSHPKGCFLGFHALNWSHAPWETPLLPGVQDTFSLCSSLISTPAPAGLSNTHLWGLRCGSRFSAQHLLTLLPLTCLCPPWRLERWPSCHSSPGFLFQQLQIRTVHGKNNMSYIYNLKCSSSHIKKVKSDRWS